MPADAVLGWFIGDGGDSAVPMLLRQRVKSRCK
jgi:hypothetical protein